MIKTEIIGFCQKINRIVKLVELSDTLTKNSVGGMNAVAGRGWGVLGQEGFFPLRLFKPIFFWIYWWWTTEKKRRFLPPPPPPKSLKKSYFGGVSPQRLILQLLTQSGVCNYHISTCIVFLINNISISYRLSKHNIFLIG